MIDFHLETSCPQSIPSQQELFSALKKADEVLTNEDASYRPLAKNKKSGALLEFNDEVPTLLVPDLHARYDFLVRILTTQKLGKSVLELVAEGSLRLIFVGDGLHSERRGFERWKGAYDAYLKGDILSPMMNQEMAEGLNLMLLVMKLKAAFPKFVHFLKGNHENILNSESCGNHPFYKFADEGQMSADFMQKSYDSKTVALYCDFENHLPLFVKGRNFLVSHAEPLVAYTKEQIINACKDSSVIEGLTWTRNDAAIGNPAVSMLEAFFGSAEGVLYFGGHRPVTEKYGVREDGHFIQIHNPDYQRVFLLDDDILNFENKIIDLEE